MELKEIEKIINMVSNSKLSFFNIEKDGFKISMGKDEINKKDLYKNKEGLINDSKNYKNEEDQYINEYYEEEKSKHENLKNIKEKDSVNESRDDAKQQTKFEENIEIIKAPLVGIFYRAAAPGQEPYIKVGDKVKKGDVLCIIEAMKLMNEIESTEDGQIIDVLVQDGQMVEYDQHLFRLKK